MNFIVVMGAQPVQCVNGCTDALTNQSTPGFEGKGLKGCLITKKLQTFNGNVLF